jgi:hypothetical protein
MTAPLPALPTSASTWDQALYAFLVEKGNRSGSRRTVAEMPNALDHHRRLPGAGACQHHERADTPLDGGALGGRQLEG